MARVAVVVFPGSNCDADTLAAAREGGSEAYYVWHRETDLQRADVERYGVDVGPAQHAGADSTSVTRAMTAFR